MEVSEIGLGAEWLERHDSREIKEVIDTCEAQGINILDCWMSEPNVRSNIGAALKGRRRDGLYRDISVPHGRKDSTCAPAVCLW